MATVLNKLSARAVATIAEPGRHSDGGGLYLVVGTSGQKSWLYMFKRQGRRREMGLGSVQTVSLAEAREAARAAAKIVQQGGDPIEVRKLPSGTPTFGAVADALVNDLKGGWRGAKTEDSWRRSLVTQAKDIRDKPVNTIGHLEVLKVVKPLWTTRPESAAKLRERIERVLDAARAKGHITGPWENPARWRGHLDLMLPARQKLTRGHQRAVAYTDIPRFMQRLREQTAPSAVAMEWTVLTAAREGMTLGATWGEIQGDVWIIAGARMKEGKPHRVPLAARCLELIRPLKPDRVKPSDLIFPNMRGTGPMSNATLDRLLDRMKVDATPHGFRSTFRDWAGDCTPFPREVVEEALAHAIGDAVERAYRRGDALEKRRKLMEAWATYCTTPPQLAQGASAGAPSE